MCLCVALIRTGLACIFKLTLLVKHSWVCHTYQTINYMTSMAASQSHQNKLGLNKSLASKQGQYSPKPPSSTSTSRDLHSTGHSLAWE